MNITFFKIHKNIIKNKNFKKFKESIFKKNLQTKKRKTNLLKIYIKYRNTIIKKIENFENSSQLVLCLSQKTHNPKISFFRKKVLNTFSVGSILNYFKIKQGKYVRRSIKGTKVFLNLIGSILKKKYLLGNKGKHLQLLINIAGFNYNYIFLKKSLHTLFKQTTTKNINYFLILNLKINFNKKKQKKIKSIKKRLKKKMISSFLKNIKIIK